MRPTLIAFSIALSVPVWAAQPTRHMIDRSQLAARTDRGVRPHLANRLGAHFQADASAPVQAPGVLQLNPKDSLNTAWFVTTAVIPNGSTLTAYLVLPDGTQVPLDTLNATGDIQPGQSFALPNIQFGDFWPFGVTTYSVTVHINGRDTQAAADFTVGDARQYSDLSSVVPLITSTTRQLAGNRDLMLLISGQFTTDPAYVVFEDTVAPQSAIRVSANQITVDMSQVPGLDLASAQNLLVTVGQDGWADTTVYRHIPPSPGSYNPAPQ
jgi:hypothetical protein